MRLGTCTVGRKTPLDGKLEIDEALAMELRSLGELRVSVGAARAGTARVSSFPCTCAKAAARGAHEHFFLESELFHDLVPGESLLIESEAAGLLSLRPLPRG
jgi:hypothetical protein